MVSGSDEVAQEVGLEQQFIDRRRRRRVVYLTSYITCARRAGRTYWCENSRIRGEERERDRERARSRVI